MAFCSKCGNEVATGAKFCNECGSPMQPEQQEKRKTVYEGEIHKCPNCGAVLNSFSSKCDDCGYEIRGKQGSAIVQEFSNKIHNIVDNHKKADYIKTFPVPNTKEDIFEFLLLAQSNIYTRDINGDGKLSDEEKELCNAWAVKLRQCYQKGKIVLSNTDFSKLQKVYDETIKFVEKYEKQDKVKKQIKTTTGVVAKIGQWVLSHLIFSIIALFLLIFEITQITSGAFSGVDIFMVAIILGPIYALTCRKKKKN